jgi:membrane protein DedA with SNARE-associated domain
MSIGRWIAAGALTLALILIPFGVAGGFMESWTPRQISAQSTAPAIAALVVTLLGADVLLPVPSSIVSTMAGSLLGFPSGFLASLLGMTLGSQLGYSLGRWSRAPLARTLIPAADLARVSERVNRGGLWALAIMRPVPVLAEASAFWAGVMRVSPVRFTCVTLIANAGVSALYAAAGAALF